MAITLLQSISGAFLSETLPSGTTTGRVIVTVMAQATPVGNFIIGMAPISGVTWVKINPVSQSHGTYQQVLAIFEGYNVPNGTTAFSATATGSNSANINSSQITIMEFSGLDSSTSSALDQYNTSSVSGPTVSTPSITPANPNELWIGYVCGTADTTTSNPGSPSNSWTSVSSSSYWYYGTAYYVSSDSSSHTTSWTFGSSNSAITDVATFKKAPVTTGDFFQFFT